MLKSSNFALANVMDALIKNPSIFFVVVDADARITTISQTLLDILEMTEDEVLGRDIGEIIPDGKLTRVLETGCIDEADVVEINGHNTIVNRVPIIKEGRIIGAVASSLFLDISYAQELIDKFNETEPKTDPELDTIINELIDSPAVGYIIIDRNGHVSHVNQTYLDVLAKSRRDVIGKHVKDITPHSRLPRILESGRVDKVDIWSVNNHHMIVNRLPIVKDHQVIGAIGHTLTLDVTAHEFLMDKLQENNEFNIIFQGLIENPYTAYVIVDHLGYITIVNNTFLKLLKMPREAVIGKYILDIVPNSKLPEILATGRTDKADIWGLHPDEDIIVDRLPIKKDGQIIGAIAHSVVLDMNEVKSLIRRLQDTQKELFIYKEEIRSIYKAKWQFEDLIGQSREFTNIKDMARQFSKTSSTLLITGESGTGKELFAQAVHNASSRSLGPFIRINCAALPENLLESELFGYEEGAFTGAKKGGKPGKFELAKGGTIFLDEIGDMPFNMQTKLLAVLQERVVERVGGTSPIDINVRVIAATNRDLEKMINNHEFREDLYYRLNVVQLRIPPLRKRLDDLPLLAYSLIVRLNHHLGTSVNSISDEAMEILRNYTWPGNVRELENLLERAINLAHMNFRNCIQKADLPSLYNDKYDLDAATEINEEKTLAEKIEDIEKELIIQALTKSGNNKSKTAKLLGIHSSALYRKLNKYGLS
ncbi:RNA polymerase sigma factor 54 interaction domain [Syntrophomonas zehnderi OL-4]|uniref:RNA polymerase sigma factor 54 interaction domain n=1 Tax=Syntrophomonas zehnderi OL-4 TaxID=690567 RepID=A0A0E4GC60_9FIRM|nr:sigma 54-interacting transcriptional regulator [Syntrophomonas zehnderi]CFY10387.1 RNA polymerase sigma factor 54 interaction domain [Syntrophomonas zehnderi OL-4]